MANDLVPYSQALSDPGSTATSLESTDVIAIAREDATKPTGFKSMVTRLLTLAKKIVSGIDYSTELTETDAKTITGAINEVAQNSGSVDITTAIDTPASVQTFSNGGDNIPLKSLVTKIMPIQAGSGVPSPQNERSISGHSNCTVTVKSGNNKFTNNTYQASANSLIIGNTDTSYIYYLYANKTYYLVIDVNKICAPSFKKTYNTATTLTVSTIGRNVYEITPSVSGNYRFNLYNSNGFDSSDVNSFALYEFYTVTIPFGQTVYGGTLECVEGNLNLTIDRVLFEYDGSEDETWQKISGTGKFYIVNTDMTLYEIEGKISNVYPFSGNTTSSASVTVDKSFYTQTNFDTPNINRVWVYNSDYENYSNVQFREVLSNQPITILAFLVNPIRITIPGVNLPTFSGTNEISTDCGDIQSLEYFNENGDDIANMVRLMTRT